MLHLPETLSSLIHRLSRISGVGPKSAERMALAILAWDKAEVDSLSSELIEAVSRVSDCPRCGCLAQDGSWCQVCDDLARDGSVVCVVEEALDAVALERGGTFAGRYHVLGGVLSPVRGKLPENLRVSELLQRIKDESIKEVIIATNAGPEGEATAMFLKQELASTDVALTRLARGLPSGGQVDYADSATLKSALDNRTEY